MTETAPLSQLRFGHDKDAPQGLNARKVGRDQGIDVLAKSIRHYVGAGGAGLILPLAVVRPNSAATYYVIDGNRRLAALKQLEQDGVIAKDHGVPIIEHDLDAALSKSLTTSITALPLHPVDRYEAFAALSETMDEKEIAACFGLKPKEVKQSLALGQLSPKVREAWRNGEIEADAAQTFTLAEPKRQDEVLAKLGGQRRQGNYHSRIGQREVRREIVGERNDAHRFLAVVGEEAYTAAGGKLIKDLFGKDHVVSDLPLLKQLADAKLKEKCADLLAEGWSWALTESELDFERYAARHAHVEPVYTKDQETERSALQKELAKLEEPIPDNEDDDANWERQDEINSRLDAIDEQASAAGFTPEQKAKTGCIVGVDHHGELHIELGIIRPGESKETAKGKTGDKDKAKPGAPKISNALHHRLSATLTLAAQNAVVAEKNPLVGLCVLISGALTAMSYGSAVCVTINGMRKDQRKPQSFESVFADVLKLPANALHQLAAKLASEALDFQEPTPENGKHKRKASLAVCEAITPKVMNDALVAAFDAKDYFASVSKALCLKAIEEALNKDEARKIGSKPKAEIGKFCVKNVPETKWLPPELRTQHYDGPGAKGSKPKAGKPKTGKARKAPAKTKRAGRKAA